MIHLVKVDAGNFNEIIRLRVSEEQKSFVAANDLSLIEAYCCLSSGGHVFPFGIYDEETPVGFVMIGYGVEEGYDDAPQEAYDNYSIWRFMIDARYQHKGYGKEALQKALQFIRTFPCGEAELCWLSYEPANTAAQKLYKSFGYEETGNWDGDEKIAVLKL